MKKEMDLRKLLDIRKLIEYGQILIEFDDDGVSVVGIQEGKITTRIPLDSNHLDNENTIKCLCKVMQTINYLIGWDSTKHAAYRMECGLRPNDDITTKKLEKVLDKETQNKLYEAGYEIIRRVD